MLTHPCSSHLTLVTRNYALTPPSPQKTKRSGPLLHERLREKPAHRWCEVQELVKVQGIKCLAEEKNPALMNKLADCMSQVAAQTWMNEQERWTGLLQHMQQFIAGDDPHQLEVALVLFSKLTEWLDQDDLLQQQTGQMYNVLLRCLQHSSRQVQLAACKASINFITVRLQHAMGGPPAPLVP
jgi:hypothetical protein